MSTPAFTVLTKAYNEERLIGQAIGSVLAQTVGDFEMIVVDDGSVDRTAEVVRGFDDPRLRLIQQENAGVGAALSTGAAAARAPRIALIDADDLWFPDYLEKMSGTLDATPGAGFAFTDAWWLQESTGRFYRQSISEYLGSPRRLPEDPEVMLASLLRSNWIFGLTMFEREAFEAVGGFDSSLRACEDYDLWLRLLAAGYRAPRAAGRLCIQRERAGSMSRNFIPVLEGLDQVYRLLAENPDASLAIQRAARERQATVDRHLAAERDEGANPLTIWWATRHQLGNLRKRVVPWSIWHRGVPGSVRRAFPDLDLGRPAPGDRG